MLSAPSVVAPCSTGSTVRGSATLGCAPAHPVAATLSLGRLTLPPPRFVQRPDVPAWEGTESLAG